MLRPRKTLSLVLVASLAISLLAGCGGAKTQNPSATGNAGTKLAANQIIRHNVGAEPQTLDPAKVTGLTEATILGALFEGLTRYDKDSKLAPGMAEKWEVSTDGLKYTFHLRDAKWSNGDPVTANDFEWAWKRALDPKMASEYAYQLYYIKNGEDYNMGKLKDASQVGVKATDAKTLVVELHSPAPQFLGLTSFQTLYPLNRKVVESNPEKWFLDTKTFVTNGPFKLVAWNHRQEVQTEKYADYWDAKSVKLAKLNFNLVDSEQTALNLFETGQIDMSMIPPSAEFDRLKAENKLVIAPNLGTYYYRFNVTKPPFNDVKVRKALTMAIDRQAIVKNITKAGEVPATAFVPFGIPDVAPGSDFRKIGGEMYTLYDLNEAKRLLTEAGYPDGKGFPSVTILINNSEKHAKIAQAIQEMWKKNLGITVNLTNQEWQVYLDSQKKLNYNISRAGWNADYVDPMTFVDMFVTNGGNNQTGWSNAQYDALVKKANSTKVAAERMGAMHQAEKIFMDEMPVMPIYFYTQPYMVNPKVKDVALPSFGNYGEFKWAYVTE